MTHKQRTCTMVMLIIALCASGMIGGLEQSIAARGARYGDQPRTAAISPYQLFWSTPPLLVPTFPPRITSVAFDPLTPGLALAGPGNSDSPIQRSIDHGRTWAPLASWNPNDQRFSYLVVWGGQQGTFYAVGAISLYKTSDGGNSWQDLSSTWTCNQIRVFLASPTNPQILYAGTMNGVARSLDGGLTWNNNMFEPGSCWFGPMVSALAASKSAAHVVYAGAGGVLRSNDDGITWQDVSGDLPGSGGSHIAIIGLAVDQRDVNKVIALTDDGRVYRTADAGSTWVWMSDGLSETPIRSIALGVEHGHRLYGISEHLLFTLEDGESAWQTPRATTIPQIASSPDRIRIVVDPSDPARIIGAGDYGIYITSELAYPMELPLVLH